MASVDRAIEASAGNAHACIFRYVVDSDFVVHEGDGVAVMYSSRKKKKSFWILLTTWSMNVFTRELLVKTVWDDPTL